MNAIRRLLLVTLPASLLACGGRAADADAARDTLSVPAVQPGDTLAVPPAMTSDSTAGAKAASPPAGGGQGGGTGATPAPASSGSGSGATKSGAAAGGLSSSDIAVVAGAAQQGSGGLQVMPWENLTPLILTDLRAVVQRQRSNHAAERRYSTSVQPLGAAARDGWTTRVVHASARGWAAVATQAFYPGRSCVVWLGSSAEEARAPRTEANGLLGEEGEPVCDRAPTR
jgi:hypothetical protein